MPGGSKKLEKEAQDEPTRLYCDKYHGHGRCNKKQWKKRRPLGVMAWPWWPSRSVRPTTASSWQPLPRCCSILRWDYSNSHLIWALEDLIGANYATPWWPIHHHHHTFLSKNQNPFHDIIWEIDRRSKIKKTQSLWKRIKIDHHSGIWRSFLLLLFSSKAFFLD